MITIPTSQKVTVQQETYSAYGYWETNVYPQKIYNSGSNDGIETVTVTLNGSKNLGTITINKDNVISDVTLTDEFDNNDELTFTFSDRFATNAEYDYYNWSWSYTWSAEDKTYTATCTVGDLLNGTATLSFTRN